MTLDAIAIKHGTDKSSLSHNYMVLYEKHLPKKVNKFLEIGVWKGEGIKSFKEYYNNEGKFYALDRFILGHGLITIGELQSEGINSFEGSQDDMWFLEQIKEKFTVISEDASHHWDSQINTFRRMFVNNLQSGGLYVCEDIFDDTYWGRGEILRAEDNLMGLLKKFQSSKNITGQLIKQQESDLICGMIDEVFIYKDIVFVTKK
jgi:hypothetical protein